MYNLRAYSIKEIPYHLRTQEICIEADDINPWQLEHIPDQYKTQEMCDKAVRISPYMLEYVPDCLKMQEMCDNAMRMDPWILNYVPHWFITQQQVKIWHDDNYYPDDDDDNDDDDELVEWYKGNKRRKVQKANIIEELMPTDWHPSRWWDWCVPEEERKNREKLQK